MSRIILILTTIATFLVVPILCMGGVLQHVCNCPNELTCSHETECDSDPCGSNALRGDELNFVDVLFTVEIDCLSIRWVSEPGETRGKFATEPEPPNSRNLPCPPSDLPLLR